jgi:hypothetical protein
MGNLAWVSQELGDLGLGFDSTCELTTWTWTRHFNFLNFSFSPAEKTKAGIKSEPWPESVKIYGFREEDLFTLEFSLNMGILPWTSGALPLAAQHVHTGSYGEPRAWGSAKEFLNPWSSLHVWHLSKWYPYSPGCSDPNSGRQSTVPFLISHNQPISKACWVFLQNMPMAAASFHFSSYHTGPRQHHLPLVPASPLSLPESQLCTPGMPLKHKLDPFAPLKIFHASFLPLMIKLQRFHRGLQGPF